jgi:hypothetical protein
VVEHLYRGERYEIVKTDTEYRTTAPQVIEFDVPIQAAGQKTIRYTVRYHW